MADAFGQADIASLWDTAVADYEQETERPLSYRELASARLISTPEDFLKQIETSGREFEDFRKKRAGLWHKLSSFVAPLSSLLKIALTPSSVSDGFGVPASAAVGACLHLVRACETVSEAYAWIEEVFSELRDFSDRLAVYVQSQLDDVLKGKIVATLAFLLRVVGRSESLIKKGRFRQYLKVAFLGKDDKTKALLDDLNKLFTSEQRYVLAATYNNTQRIEEKVDNNGAQIKKLQQRQLDAEDHERILRTLCNTSAADDVEETFYRQKRSLLKGTGTWLEQEKPFEAWLSGHAPFLWIFGGPGTGKSYLSTWLVERLQNHPGRLQEQPTTAYFFIKENNEVLRNTNNILKSLAWQLTCQDSNFKLHVAEVSKQRARTITAEDTWESVFLDYYECIRPCRPATIVIDGLDEATSLTRKTLLTLLKNSKFSSQSPNPPPIQFAIIGRTSLRHDLDFSRHQRTYYIEISKHKNHADINSYICKRLEEVEILRELRRKKAIKKANRIGIQLRNKILEGADGVFLWAKLLIDTIMHKDLVQIESILNDPPSNLDDMIWSVFDRLAKDEDLDGSLVRRMILLCSYARRPLRFGEIDLFLSLPSRKTHYLLWNHVRGKLSSVFDCKFPPGYEPDEGRYGDNEQKETETKRSQSATPGSRESQQSDDEEFDFSGDLDDDEDDSDSDGDADTLGGTTLDSSSWSLESLSADSTNQHLSKEQRQTEIAFSHIRFKDYVVREGHAVTRKQTPCSLIPDAGSAQVNLLILSLDAFRLELFPEQTPGVSDPNYLVEYPLRNFVSHMKETDRKRISDTDYCRVIEGLFWLFGTERGAECHIKANHFYDEWHSTYDEFWHTWVSTRANLQLIQDWFLDLDQRNENGVGLTGSDRSWIWHAARDLSVLLHPSMTKASKLWLVRGRHDSRAMFNKGEWPCWLLHGWLSLTQNNTLAPEVETFEQRRLMYDFTHMSAERLEAMASWAGLERNQHWHTMLGWILWSAGAHTEAKAHGIEAANQDSEAWVGMEVVARACGGLSEYRLAIEWMKRSIKAIPSNIATIAGYMWPSIYDWAILLKDESTAFEAAKTGAELNFTSLDAQVRYFRALYSRDDSEAIIHALEDLRLVTYPGKPFNQVANLFVCGLDVYDEIGKACRETDQPEWVLEDIQTALRHLEQYEQYESFIQDALRAALFSYYWYDDQEARTIEWAESFLSRLGQQSTKFQKSLVLWQRFWTSKLAQLYFDNATRLFESEKAITPRVTVFADKLKRLAIRVGADTGDVDIYLSNYAALLWGRWLRNFQKSDEDTWKKCFKRKILEKIRVLSSEDTTNGATDLRSLAITLLRAGDRRNASIIFAVLFKPLEDSKRMSSGDEGYDVDGSSGTKREENTSDGSGPEQSLYLCTNPSDAILKCDNCQRDTLDVTELYFCKICPTKWCGACLAILRNSRSGLKMNRCNPSHEAYLAWPIPEEARSLAVEHLGDQIKLGKSWLESLTAQWN